MSSRLSIEKWDPEKDGVLNEENLRRKLEKYGFTCTKYTLSPGTDFPDHTHEFDKKAAVLSGKFRFGMYGETVYLDPGDIIDVPHNTIHNTRVMGEVDAVIFDSSKSE